MVGRHESQSFPLSRPDREDRLGPTWHEAQLLVDQRLELIEHADQAGVKSGKF